MKNFILTILLAVFLVPAVQATHYWTGAVNQLWNNPNNWDMGTVPGSGDDVIIVSGTTYPCWISSADQMCNNLFIMGNASLRIYGHQLTVYGAMSVYGTLIMDNSASKLFVFNKVIWYSGSQANITAWAPIKVYGDWEFRSGANVHLDNGFVEFMGNSTCNIICKSTNSYFHGLVMTYSHNTIFSTSSTADLVINYLLQIASDAVFSTSSDKNIILNGQFISTGDFSFNNGTFIYQGPSSSVSINSSDHFYNLTVNSSGTLEFDNILWIYGNVNLNGGVFKPNIVFLYGDWINNVGPSAFFEGTGRIEFQGSNYQKCSSEVFYDLKVNKTDGYMYPLPGTTIEVNHYLQCFGGKLQMNTNTTLDLNGFVYFSNEGHLDASGVSGVTLYLSGGFWEDQNAILAGFIPGTSTVVFENPAYYFMLYTDAPEFLFYNVQIVGGGAVRMANVNTSILNDLTITNGSWSHDSYTSYQHKFYGDISVGQNGDFIDRSNVLFEGSSQMLNFSCENVVLGDVFISGSKSNPEKSKIKTVDIVSNDTAGVLYFRDMNITNATLKLGEYETRASGDITVGSDGKLYLNPGSHFTFTSENSLNINSGGYFWALGTAEKKVVVSHDDNGEYYGFNVNSGGTILAYNTIFEYMNSAGINVKYGAFVDTFSPFARCTFRNGEINGVLLYLNTSQTFTVTGAEFPENTWGSLFNVGRTNTSGTITFSWASGQFAGEVYDYDLNNRIFWENIPTQVSAKVFLEGAFSGTSMLTTLQPVIPLCQPYNTAPWNYSGSECVSSLPSNNIVDWVLLDLRTSHTFASQTFSEATIATRAAFVLSDGTLVDTDGSSQISFPASIDANEACYLVVRHRNHLDAMSNYSLTNDGGVYSYDFTSGPGQYVGTNQGCKYLGNNLWGMIAGDADANGTVDYDDIVNAWNNTAGSSGYVGADLNMNTQVNNNDKNEVLIPNLWKESQVPQ